MNWIFIQKALALPENNVQEVHFRVGAGCVRIGMQCVAVKRGEPYLDIEAGSPPVLRVALIPANGTVTSIVTYDREVAELRAGWTGKLLLRDSTCPLFEWDHVFLARSPE